VTQADGSVVAELMIGGDRCFYRWPVKQKSPAGVLIPTGLLEGKEASILDAMGVNFA
jgi:hypothetical protein